VDALKSSVDDTPGHRLLIMHGGQEQREGAAYVGGKTPAPANDTTTSVVKLIAKPTLPKRLKCGCSGGNGGTPFLFMQWWGEAIYVEFSLPVALDP
jgi:hypothetical protein